MSDSSQSKPVPIIIHAWDPDELHFFRSANLAAGYLEAIDVENGEYPETYDAEGRRFKLSTKRVPSTCFFGLIQTEREVVEVAPLETEPTATGELASLLRAFLHRKGRAASHDATLQELLDSAIALEGYTL